ncbi:MAG: hypothetical protein RIT45_1038 [Pseudomonadota bacterium]|jgi:hypothetical protein
MLRFLASLVLLLSLPGTAVGGPCACGPGPSSATAATPPEGLHPCCLAAWQSAQREASGATVTALPTAPDASAGACRCGLRTLEAESERSAVVVGALHVRSGNAAGAQLGGVALTRALGLRSGFAGGLAPPGPRWRTDGSDASAPDRAERRTLLQTWHC